MQMVTVDHISEGLNHCPAGDAEPRDCSFSTSASGLASFPVNLERFSKMKENFYMKFQEKLLKVRNYRNTFIQLYLR
jgi:hypothetical protein